MKNSFVSFVLLSLIEDKTKGNGQWLQIKAKPETQRNNDNSTQTRKTNKPKGYRYRYRWSYSYRARTVLCVYVCLCVCVRVFDFINTRMHFPLPFRIPSQCLKAKFCIYFICSFPFSVFSLCSLCFSFSKRTFCTNRLIYLGRTWAVFI